MGLQTSIANWRRLWLDRCRRKKIARLKLAIKRLVIVAHSESLLTRIHNIEWKLSHDVTTEYSEWKESFKWIVSGCAVRMKMQCISRNDRFCGCIRWELYKGNEMFAETVKCKHTLDKSFREWERGTMAWEMLIHINKRINSH